MTRPTVSLAMIVKNEEGNLPRCLDSVRGCFDEIVVVDTGSRDRTREIAVKYGASVYQFDERTNPEAFFLDDEATCKKFGAPPPYSGEWTLADFGAARQKSFDATTGDFVMWVDADDEVEGGRHVRDAVADLQSKGLDFGFFAYDYAIDYMGRSYYQQWRERLIRRGSARWVNPVHEVLLPWKAILPQRYGDVRLKHRRKADRPGTPNRNYKILLRQLWQLKTAGGLEAPVDPRSWFYLGQEARFVEPTRAVGFYEEYLKHSGWSEERAAAHMALGHIWEFNMVGIPPDEALARANKEYAAAAAEMPENPDGLFGLARVAKLRERWQDCVNYSDRGFGVGNTDTMLGYNPMDRLYRPHFYYNEALSKLGRVDDAISSCRKALEVCPDDPGVWGAPSGMITYNLRVYEEGKMQAQAQQPEGRPVATLGKDEDLDAPPAPVPVDAQVIWAIQLWKQCIAAGDAPRALSLLESLPVAAQKDPVVAQMYFRTQERFPGAMSPAMKAVKAIEGMRAAPAPISILSPATPGAPPLRVAIWTGHAFEKWDPTTPNQRGIGGSETACVEIARHLVELGHAVDVYGDPPARGAHGGVNYIPWQEFAHAAEAHPIDCDVFISSRVTAVADLGKFIRAKLRLLWVHDIHCGPNSPQMETQLYWFDRVLCLSEWHKDYFCSVYPTLHPDRVAVTRNGIEPSRFSKVVAKRNDLVFSSSPNRGLAPLLYNFQEIRRRVPDAELHVYYGFDCWETLARQRGAQAELDQIAEYKKLIDEAVRRGGVHFHGRVPQQQLADAFMRAKVWPYLTDFPETSCITAMEAQAAGCVPVTSAYAALRETVKYGVLVDVGAPERGLWDPTKHAYREASGQEWVDRVVTLLTNESSRAPIAAQGRAYALEHLSWASLARDWEAKFRGFLTEVSQYPVAMWREAAS